MAWNRNEIKTGLPPKRTKGGFAKRMVSVILLLITVGGGVVWFALRQDAPKGPESAPRTPARIRTVKTQVPTNAPVRRTVADIVRARGGMKNLTPEDKAEIAELRREKMARRGEPPMPGAAPRVRRIFECHSDQIISMVVTGGDSIPPFPGTNESLEREFVRSLGVPIVINEDDGEDVKKAKQMVIDARAVIDEEMKKGRGFREILEEYRRQVNDNTKMRREVRATAGEIMREDGVEAAEQYVGKANEKLKGWGMSGVDRPRTREEIQTDLRQRHLERQDKVNQTTKENTKHE